VEFEIEENLQRGVSLGGRMDGGDKVGINVGGAFKGHGLYHYHIHSCIAICL